LYNFCLADWENIGRVKLVGRDAFALEVSMVALTLIGLLLSLAQVLILLRASSQMALKNGVHRSRHRKLG